MEKDSLFVNGSGISNGLSYRAAMDIHSSDQMIQASSSSEHNLHSNSFLTLNWVDNNNNNPIDQRTLQFHSAMSSMVSSPTSPRINPGPESVAISELIGRLGSISNSEEFSPQSHTMGNYFGGNLSANTSCYSTPLNSPPKLNLGSMDYSRSVNNLPIGHQSLAQFAADPGFAERAARFSCIANRGFNGFPESELSYSGKLSKVSSSQCLTGGSGVDIDGRSGVIGNAGDFGSDRKFNRSSTPALEDTELGIGREESSASDPAAGEINGKKRKAIPKGKAKEAAQQPSSPPNLKAAEDESRMKKSRDIEKEEMKPKTEESNAVGDVEGKQGKETSKPPEPPKDYIHVRARRGQATDSHSLAERVRREKISERMKFLQDLVPGCNKVTGKAVMLDEIINYVQSLQRQVEFLSMKLATVNPRLDLNMEGVLQKDMLQQRGSSSMVYPMDSCASAFPFPNHVHSTISSASETQCSVNPLDSSSLRRSLSMQLPSADAFGDASSQLAAYFEDELQSIVQMGFGQNQEMAFSSQNFHGSLPTSHMKIEL